MAQSIQHLRGTAAQWAANDIIVPIGELALLIDGAGNIASIRIGNGVDVYSALSDFGGGTGGPIAIGDVTGLTAALDAKEDDANKGATNGYAPLVSGTVPSIYLPAFVDDILPFATVGDFPVVGERGKIYEDLSATVDPQYRWNGSGYSQIISSPGTTDALTEGSSNLYFTAARVRAALLTGLAAGANAVIAATDSVMGALANLQAQVTNRLTQAAADALYAPISAGADPMNEDAAVFHIDEFLNNSGGTGAIGMLGWKFINGTVYVPAVRQGYPGLVGLRTSAAAGQVCSFFLANAVGTNIFRFDEFEECRFIIIPTAANTDCAYQYGPMSAYGVLTPTAGIYVERLATDTNYFFVCRAAGVQTRVDSGVAFAASAINLRIRRVGAADVRFSLNGGAETTITTNVPAAATGLNIGLQRTPTTATTRDLDLDRIALKLVPIAR